MAAAGRQGPETWRWPASARIWTRLDSLTEQPLLCVTVKVRSRSLQKPADGASRRIYASRQVRGGVPSLTSTHGSRHAARRPGPIGAWTAVTPVTAVHPPFAYLWSAVKEFFSGAPTGCCLLPITGACQEAADVSPATQRITTGPGRKVPGHIAIYRTLILNSRPCEATHRLPTGEQCCGFTGITSQNNQTIPAKRIKHLVRNTTDPAISSYIQLYPAISSYSRL